MQFGFGSYLTPHYTLFYFCDHIYDTMQYGLEFSQNHNRTAPYFEGYMCGAVYKMQFKQFETNIFFKFWVFSSQPKIDLSTLF